MNLKNRIKSMAKQLDAVSETLQVADISDEDALNFISFYPVWTIGEKYKKDEIFQYNDKLYQVSQNVTASQEYPPDAEGVESLYTEITIDPETGYEEWKRPTGEHDAYSKGDIVSYNGKVWISIVNGKKTNTWEPGVYGWEEYIPKK